MTVANEKAAYTALIADLVKLNDNASKNQIEDNAKHFVELVSRTIVELNDVMADEAGLDGDTNEKDLTKALQQIVQDTFIETGCAIDARMDDLGAPSNYNFTRRNAELGLGKYA
jgi:hypothetical protein